MYVYIYSYIYIYTYIGALRQVLDDMAHEVSRTAATSAAVHKTKL